MTRTKRNVTGVVFLLLAARGSSRARAQAPPEVPRVTGSVELSILNIDVVVREKDGTPVRGLRPTDFDVRVARKSVDVTNFSEYGADPVPPSGSLVPADSPAPGVAAAPVLAAPAPPVGRPRRSVVLFIDRQQIPEPDVRARTFGSLKTLVEKTLGPGDEAMIVTWQRGVRGLLSFTSDRGAIARYLDLEEGRSMMLPAEAIDLDQLSRDAAWFRSLGPQFSSRDHSVGPSQRALAAEAYAEMRGKASALQALIATLAGIDGRKILVLTSNRFSRYAGLEFFLGRHDGIGKPRPDDANEFDARSLVESVTDAANASGVTIYSIYPPGWGNDPPDVSAANSHADYPSFTSGAPGGRRQVIVSNENDALRMVSDGTGGLVALGPVSLAKMVPRVADDLSSYYSLGVPAPAGKPGRAISIDVRVKGRDVRVRTRQSVVVKTPIERMRDRVLANLFRIDPSSHIAITAKVRPAALVKKGRFEVPVEVTVPIGSLALLPGPNGGHGTFSVFVASADPEGNFTEVTRQTRPFEVARTDLARAKTSHFTYEFALAIKSQARRVSIGVLDEVGNEAGFVRLEIAAGAPAGGS